MDLYLQEHARKIFEKISRYLPFKKDLGSNRFVSFVCRRVLLLEANTQAQQTITRLWGKTITVTLCFHAQQNNTIEQIVRVHQYLWGQGNQEKDVATTFVKQRKLHVTVKKLLSLTNSSKN